MVRRTRCAWAHDPVDGVWIQVSRDKEKLIGSRREGSGHPERLSSQVPTNARVGDVTAARALGALHLPFKGFSPCSGREKRRLIDHIAM